ncbi:MAG: heparinase II/III family protein, partial [Acidobacteriota bacterium]
MRKLRRFSFDELRVRGAQKVAALGERRGWSSLTRLPAAEDFYELLDLTGDARHLRSAQEIFNYFRSHKFPSPSAFDDREITVDILKSRWPQAVESVFERAGKILEGKFDLLALRDLDVGDPIDWHFEPVSGKRSPLLHWSRLNELDAELSGDKKIIWELNRHQHFVLLGQAYWLSNDERYAKAFVSHLESWMNQNPPKLGVHWASSLEIAFRSISWLWAFRFFEHSPSLGADVFTRALKFLYLNARHLETYLSTYFSPNTHLTGEALGLFYL